MGFLSSTPANLFWVNPYLWRDKQPKMITKVSSHTLYTCLFLPLPQATTETHRALEPSSQNESGPLRAELGCKNFPFVPSSVSAHSLGPWRPRNKTGFPREGCGF